MRNSMKLGCVVAVLALVGSVMDGDQVASAKRARKTKVRAPAKSSAAPADPAAVGGAYRILRRPFHAHRPARLDARPLGVRFALLPQARGQLLE